MPIDRTRIKHKWVRDSWSAIVLGKIIAHAQGLFKYTNTLTCGIIRGLAVGKLEHPQVADFSGILQVHLNLCTYTLIPFRNPEVLLFLGCFRKWTVASLRTFCACHYLICPACAGGFLSSQRLLYVGFFS